MIIILLHLESGNQVLERFAAAFLLEGSTVRNLAEGSHGIYQQG